jgi:hypothetical protein
MQCCNARLHHFPCGEGLERLWGTTCTGKATCKSFVAFEFGSFHACRDFLKPFRKSRRQHIAIGDATQLAAQPGHLPTWARTPPGVELTGARRSMFFWQQLRTHLQSVVVLPLPALASITAHDPGLSHWGQERKSCCSCVLRGPATCKTFCSRNSLAVEHAPHSCALGLWPAMSPPRVAPVPRLCAYHPTCCGTHYRPCPLCYKSLCGACFRRRTVAWDGRCGPRCLKWVRVVPEEPEEWGPAKKKPRTSK